MLKPEVLSFLENVQTILCLFFIQAALQLLLSFFWQVTNTEMV